MPNRSNRLLTYVICVSCILQPACTSLGKSGNKNPLIPKASKPAMARFLQGCPLNMTAGGPEFAFPLAAALGVAVSALVPPAIEAVTNNLSEWLEDRANKRNASTTATGTGMLWKVDEKDQVSPHPKCLVFVRGDFASADPDDVKADSALAGKWSAADTRLVNDRLGVEKAGFYLKSTPQLYVEFRIDYLRKKISKATINAAIQKLPEPNKPSAQQEDIDTAIAMRLHPITIAYLKSGAEKGADDEKKLIVEVKVEGNTASKGNPESHTLLNHPFDFGKMSIPSRLKSEDLIGMPIVEGPVIPPFSDSVYLLVKNQILEVQDPNLVRIIGTVISTETEDGGDVERAFAKSIKDKSDDLSKLVTDYLNELVKKTEETKGGQ